MRTFLGHAGGFRGHGMGRGEEGGREYRGSLSVDDDRAAYVKIDLVT